MKVGFTGTREGMTDIQFAAFVFELPEEIREFHQGCCIGADEQAALHVHTTEEGVSIIGYPSTLGSYVSEKALKCCNKLYATREPLLRTKDIVDACELLIAAPKGEETIRSGTWSTIRYARSKWRKVIVVWPNGDIT